MKQIYPNNVYELRETLLDKLDAFKIRYKQEQNLLKKLTVFDFDSICVKEDSYKETETTKYIAKPLSISVFISSKFIQEPIFCCNAIPHYLVLFFITALKGLATQSKAQIKLSFFWSWDSNQGKVVQTAGTAEPNT